MTGMRAGVEWFIWLETNGIMSFAINAMIVARGKGMTMLGMFICAVATALGGGTLRDILLGPSAQPFFWVAHPFYIVAIFFIALLYAHLDVFRDLVARRAGLFKDVTEALALSSLGALGAAKAFTLLSPSAGSDVLSSLHLWILCSFFGAVSAAFGSIIRDMIIGEFPASLKPGPSVLEALFVGSGVLTALLMAGVAQPWAVLWGFTTTFLIRLLVMIQARKPAPETAGRAL